MADQKAYQAKLKEEQARYGRGPMTGRGGVESARDAAVRATNIATGMGNSTALKYPQNAPAPKQAGGGRSGGGRGGKPGGPKTGSTSPFRLNRSSPMADRNAVADPSVMTSPSAAGGFYGGSDPLQLAGATSPSSLGGFYTGADPGLTQSPTSVMQPSRGPTSVMQPSRGPTTQPGLQGPAAFPSASVGLGMQPKFPYDMPSPSNVRPTGSLLIPNYGPGVGMPDVGAPGAPPLNPQSGHPLSGSGHPVVGSGHPVIKPWAGNPFGWF